MFILGISAYYHDSAACLIQGEKIIAAAQEERFTRKKHDQSFPKNAISYCLKEANISPCDISYIVFYDKPFLKFERLLETYLAFAPKGFRSFSTSMPLWIKDKLFQKSMIRKELEGLFSMPNQLNEKLLFSEHHLSHAASAFYPSPFDEAAILTMDGVGEWTTTSLAIGKGNNIDIKKEIHFPHSLGLLYSAFTYYSGFKVNSGEYKLMGLAPYGEPKYESLIKENLISIKKDGSYRLDMSFFGYCTGLTMTNEKFHNLFGGLPRKPETELTQKNMDIAASIQKVTEEVVEKLALNISEETGQKNLCLAGGVALNCVANGNLLRKNIFENIWIQPASGDAGGSLGAALSAYHLMLNKPRLKSDGKDRMNGSFLGPRYSNKTAKDQLKRIGAHFNEFSESEIIDRTAEALSNEKAIGWMDGRMEFGPRALGARSILADARSPYMQKNLNLKIKYRESFRPFAPSITREDVGSWFDLNTDSPYMLLVAEVNKKKRLKIKEDNNENNGLDKLLIPRSVIPAVTHVDFSSRVQTVHKEINPKYHQLLLKFKDLTGCPVLVNTSFNIRGEPIVCSPKDAFKCFMATDLDALVIGNIMLLKEDQNLSLKAKYHLNYDLD
jgi:carbamoyltransferase